MDPVTLQVMLGALRSVCDEMGAVLVRSAHSANIKERRDSSTALFDARGQMVMQAEHIPVHLGAMPTAVAAVLDEEHRPGDAWILNDPYRGGTHLPDITLVSPVFADGDLIGFAANRAHHADVGGRTPGSMPADSRTLDEEGVVIPPSRLDDELIAELSGRMRGPAQRRADLRAQLAANRTGGARLAELAERHGRDLLREAMDATLDYAERRTRARIAELPDGEREAVDRLEAVDGDLELRLRAVGRGRRARARLLRQRRAARGQPELPARGDALGVLLRGARPGGSGRAAERRSVAAGDRARARGLAPERAPAGGRGCRQRRDLVESCRPGARRLRSRPRPGDDEQSDAGQRSLHLLRDARRRPGRLSRRAPGRARCTWP